MPSTRRSGFPTFCRTCLEKGCSPPLYSGVCPAARPRRGRGSPPTSRGGVHAARIGVGSFGAAGSAGHPALIALIAPGFSGQKREITIRLVRILFPGAGLLVLSAWCLGVLNSHRRFFLSYTAPVLWNIAIIATLIAFGRSVHGYGLAEYAAWGSVLGSALQFGVQLPPVLGALGGLTLTLQRRSAAVRTVIRNFVPVFIGRGVVQISAYVDTGWPACFPLERLRRSPMRRCCTPFR